MKTTIISKIQDMQSVQVKDKTIGFVPTMGFLHEGHLSLVEKARTENDTVVVSIFVNPTQFGANEDFSRYPRNVDRDVKLLEETGVDFIFIPNTKSMYPKGYETFVEPTGLLATEVEGAARPGHFRGMATIVLKLFNIIKPTNAYFGQKDAQQAVIVRQMITDLNLPIKLHICPTIREKDGLAMSSRNAYLSETERQAAPILYKSLLKVKENLATNPGQHSNVLKNIGINMVKQEALVRLEYFEIRHPETFVKLERIESSALFLIAAKVGKARLIDNFLLKPNGQWETGIII